ncbi:MAG: ribonuclease J [Deltaproteobacteria bacterium]|nr:ribonuclease J [Deltaproteobacteria bacterium]
MSQTRIVPLGGLGEVGMNCLAIESRDGIVIVDCGVTFPHDQYGIDLIHPDFSWLWERRDQVRGLIVTHGHEDHIGAIPYLLRMIPMPVYAPAYARVLIEHRLSEHPDIVNADLHTTAPRKKFSLGSSITVEPLRVTHSIPDATAFCIDVPGARVFHTGDFKLEEDPPDGEASDIQRFQELGREGIDVLLSDSTNVDVATRKTSERSVSSALTNIIAKLEGRVVVGLFASNIYRLQAIANAAIATQRRLCLLGRSVQTHVKAAQALGKLKFPSDLLVSPEVAMTLAPHTVLAIATGTQAEPASAIARLARNDHPFFRLERRDTVIFSSRTIPGSERAVFGLICDLERAGVNVHFSGIDSEIHVSGHAARDEQSRMIELTKPRSFIPLHGTFHHLKRHAELARSMGVENTLLLENGDTARWSNGQLAQDGGVPHGRVHIDEGQVVAPPTLEERKQMSESGTVFAQLHLDKIGMLSTPFAVTTRGVLLEEPAHVLEGLARSAVSEALRLARGPREVLTPEEARDAAARTLRRIYRVGHRRPLVVVQVKSVGGPIVG